MDILKKRWIYVFNSFIILLFMGCSYAWSIFVVPLETTYGWSRSETSLAFTLNLLFFSVGSILVGIFSKKLSFSTLLKIASTMIAMGFFMSSIVNNPWQIYFTYSFLCGCGIGAGYSCVVSATPLWFPDKTGMVTGTLLMGYALSTAIFGPLINSLITVIGISNTFKVLAAVCFSGLMSGSLLLKIPTYKEHIQLPHPKRHSEKKEYNLITSEMIKKPIFWVYYVLSALLAGTGLTIINHASPILTEDLLMSTTLASLIISIISICNGAGRVIWGILFDKLGVKKVLSYISFIMLLSVSIMIISLMISIPYLFIFSSCILLFAFGGNAALMPTMIRELFGHRTYSLNYSILSTSCIIQSSLPTVIGTIHTYTNTYLLPISILFMIGLLNLLLLFIMIKLYNKEYVN